MKFLLLFKKKVASGGLLPDGGRGFLQKKLRFLDRKLQFFIEKCIFWLFFNILILKKII
jgi:hypothetical protein